MSRITAVISFCSNDWRFLRRCIEGVSPACQKIIVTVCDHFFDGTEENYALLHEAFRQFPQCTFLEFCFHPSQTYRPFSPLFPEHIHWRHEWHNTGRWLAYLYAAKETDYFLFLDCDEIVDASAFSEWLPQHSFDACRFAAYWHFREAKFEALAQDDVGLLVKTQSVHSEFFWSEHERSGIFHQIEGEKKLDVKGLDGRPMMRHYSGVRTKDELQKKLSAWGHHWERDWLQLLEEEYSRPFNGSDFVRRYQYQEVAADFDPLAVVVPVSTRLALEQHLEALPDFRNVMRVTREEAFRMDLEITFAIYEQKCFPTK